MKRKSSAAKTPSTPPAATGSNFVRYAGTNEAVQIGCNYDSKEYDDPEAPVYEYPD